MLDYKRIIKSRKVRLQLLRLFSFVPDELMIRLQYRIKTGRILNLNNPTRYTEKMQYLKLHYKTPLVVKCTDKYDVRQYVEACGYGKILNHCYGVYESSDDIDFNKLPTRFVLKDTLGSAAQQIIIVKDKSVIDRKDIRNTLDSWTKENHRIKDGGREWAYYSGKPHRIIVEDYIESNPLEGGLIDYKIFCFNGIAKYMYVICDRKMGSGAGLGIYDINFNKLPYYRADEQILKRDIKKPSNIKEMIEIAEDLSKPFPYVRVDLYNVNNHIIFGELSFYDGSGYMTFEPDDFDYILGKELVLPIES